MRSIPDACDARTATPAPSDWQDRSSVCGLNAPIADRPCPAPPVSFDREAVRPRARAANESKSVRGQQVLQFAS